jgi:hypothetical protein
MKMERKLPDFSVENRNGMKIWKWNGILRTEAKREFVLAEAETERHSGGTDVETEFPFYDCFAWPIYQA